MAKNIALTLTFFSCIVIKFSALILLVICIDDNFSEIFIKVCFRMIFFCILYKNFSHIQKIRTDIRNENQSKKIGKYDL